MAVGVLEGCDIIERKEENEVIFSETWRDGVE